jgi:anti-anti-sigma factor
MTPVTPCHVPVVEVYVTERLDVTRLPAVRPVLDTVVRLRPDRLVLDVAGCAAIDAAGIGLLLDVHRDLWRAGARLLLRSPTPRLRRTLRIARVDNVLSIVPEIC